MKLYAHWEGDKPFTKIIKTADGETVVGLREACWAALRARQPELPIHGAASLQLLSLDRQPLPLTRFLPDVLSNGDDVILQLRPGTEQKPEDARVGANTPSSSATATPTSATSMCAATDGTTIKAKGQPQPPPQPQPGPQSASGFPSGPSAAGPSKPSRSPAAYEDLMPLVRSCWLRAETLASQQNYRAAGETLQQVLLLVPEPSSPPHLSTLSRLARMWLDAGNAAAAMRWALAAAERRPEDPEVLELAGDCLREGGRPREAAAQYQSALDVLEEGGKQDPSPASGPTPSTPSSASSAQDPSGAQLRLRLSLAACLHQIPGRLSPPFDNQDLAASLVMAVLERNPGHWEALRLYARIALDRGLREDGLRVALRLVVGQPQHRGAKALLAECLQDSADVQRLFQELGVAPEASGTSAAGDGGSSDSRGAAKASGSSSGGDGDGGGSSGTAAALGFVATAIKDHGQVDSCIALLQRAVQLDPGSASYCLNLLHALELRQELQAAVEAARSYCRRSSAQLAELRLRDVDSLLSGLPSLPLATALTWYHSKPLWDPARELAQQQQKRQWQQEHGNGDGDAGGSGTGGGAAEAEAGAGSAPSPVPGATPDQGQAQVQGTGERQEARQQAVVNGGSRADDQGGTTGQPTKVLYTPDQLDELALLFTLIKVLFVGGALREAARVCELVEPVRRASAVELHTTLIRNEAAYFGCVSQLLRDHPPPPVAMRQPLPTPTPPPSALPSSAGGEGAAAASTPTDDGPADGPAPLYLCGDSHCLSAAWRLVTLRGQQRLLRPLLVTGCKVWHLRPASVFYPKKQFEATTRLLPDGAQVVLVLGEIDCREGLLLAVQKGKYDSVAEGIEATVRIYLDVLRSLISGRGMEIFVHPVPPVLNETRPIVTPFAAALRRAIAAARAADAKLRNRLHYLDFFDQLLAPGPAAAEPPAAPSSRDGTTAAAAAAGGATAQPEAPPAGAASADPEGGKAALAGSDRTCGGDAGAIGQEREADGSGGSAAAGAGCEPRGNPEAGAAGPGSGSKTAGGSTETGAAAAAARSGGEPAAAPALPGAGAAGPAAAAATGARVLRPDLAFDGTHLAPVYLPLLDAELRGVK